MTTPSTATHIRFAVVPHRRAWDAAGIQEENRRWNEPLLCTFAAQAAADEASLIDAAGTGYEISAAYLDGEQIVVRLFNADGDGTPQKSGSPSRFRRSSRPT